MYNFGNAGTPTSDNWPDATLLPEYLEFESRQPLNLATVIRSHGIEVEFSQV